MTKSDTHVTGPELHLELCCGQRQLTPVHSWHVDSTMRMPLPF
jgi:hypothetical protein